MSYKTPITEAQIEANFQQAAEQYAAYGVDIDQAVDRALEVPISLHCWQADDVAGFEVVDEAVEGGGIMATGNYPGRARDGEELRQDLKKVVNFQNFDHFNYAYISRPRTIRRSLRPS